METSPHIFLFFDYDGTLTPIVSRPEDAKITSAAKSLIKEIQKDPRFSVSIISGRSLKDIKKMVGIKDLIYAGNHGLEIEYAGRVLKPGEKSGSGKFLRKIRLSLEKEIRHIKGAMVEDKGLTLSVHFRLVEPSCKGTVKNIFAKIVRPYVLSGKLKASSGKMVLEARPGIDWHKGKAVLYLLKKRKRALPIYVGDDNTDMDAFCAIKKSGISVFVGRPKKSICADYFLKDSKDVERFIKRLLKW